MPNTLLLDNALATMGAGLPSAIAAKLLSPHRQVVAIVGDGGFLMNSQVRFYALFWWPKLEGGHGSSPSYHRAMPHPRS